MTWREDYGDFQTPHSWANDDKEHLAEGNKIVVSGQAVQNPGLPKEAVFLSESLDHGP